MCVLCVYVCVVCVCVYVCVVCVCVVCVCVCVVARTALKVSVGMRLRSTCINT